MTIQELVIEIELVKSKVTLGAIDAISGAILIMEMQSTIINELLNQRKAA